MFKKKVVLALIPARAGSKRIKNKNLAKINDKPLIFFSLNFAKNNKKIFDRILVTTDSKKIQKIANKILINTAPFLRPKNFSNDKSSDYEFIYHSIEWLKKNENFLPDIIVLLRPTTPFRKRNLLKNMMKVFFAKNYSSIRSCREVGHNHPYWMYKFKNNNLIELINNKNFFKYYQSQTLPKVYKHDGYCDIFKTQNLYSKNKNKLKKIYGRNMNFFINKDKNFINIDNTRELNMAKIILKKYKKEYV